MTDTNNMTSDQIDTIKVEKEKEYRTAQEVLNTVELRELELAKEICKLQLERKSLQIAISKAKHNVRTLAIDIKILTSEFWRARNV